MPALLPAAERAGGAAENLFNLGAGQQLRSKRVRFNQRVLTACLMDIAKAWGSGARFVSLGLWVGRNLSAVGHRRLDARARLWISISKMDRLMNPVHATVNLVSWLVAFSNRGTSRIIAAYDCELFINCSVKSSKNIMS